jgi:Cytochrome P450
MHTLISCVRNRISFLIHYTLLGLLLICTLSALAWQVLRHGYETIAGTLSWMFYALYRHPKVTKKRTAVIVMTLHAVSSNTQWSGYVS